jgi:hypothetical protein
MLKTGLKLSFVQLVLRLTIIVICPRLEEWILEIAKQENINLSEFNLPDNPSEFHSTVNFNITNFQKLLHKLKETENKRLLALKEFILK